MNNKTNIVVGVVATIALILGFVAYNKTPSTIVGSAGQQGPAGRDGVDGRNGVDGARGPAGYSAPASPVLGALSGPDISSPYLSIGGVKNEYRSTSMRSATTTLCAMQAPTSTSTLRYVAFQIMTGTSTAATIDIATSTTAFATTTNLVTAKSIASGTQGYAVWTPVGGAVDDSKMSPNEWVNVKTAGAGLGGYTYGGQCEAVFLVL